MPALSSLLSHAVISTVTAAYTTADLVSAMTGKEILPDEVLPEWIDAACEEIDRRTGMSFRARQFENILDGDGSDTVFLDCFPILELFSLEIDGILIEPKAYTLNKRTGIIKLKTRFFPKGSGNIVVKGIEGYAKVPALVKKIATLIAAKTALSAKFDPLVDSENIGDFSQTRTFKKLNDELDRAWSVLGQRFRIFIL